MEAGERLFALEGYDGTSVRDIAMEAGVNIAMISYYFGSKDQLLVSLFEMRTTQMRNYLLAMADDPNTDPRIKMHRMIDRYVERVLNHEHFHKIMIREQIRQSPSPITELIQDLKKNNKKLVTKIVEDGQRLGVFKPEVDLTLLMMTMFGTINYMISSRHHYREASNLMGMSDTDFQTYVAEKLSAHLKTIFDCVLNA